MMANDYQQRIRERQAVFDAFERGEIDHAEYQRQLAALPKVRAPRAEDSWNPVKRRMAKVALNVVNRSLDRMEQAIPKRKVE